jgi:hypothetical protein
MNEETPVSILSPCHSRRVRYAPAEAAPPVKRRDSRSEKPTSRASRILAALEMARAGLVDVLDGDHFRTRKV